MQHVPDRDPKESRAWRLAWDALREIEARWDEEPPVRARLLLDCRRLMEASGVERLERLATLLRAELSPRELLTVLVPVERVGSRTRITDAQMGITVTDRAERQTFPLTVVADNVRSAFNLGGMFRTADAIGAEALWLCGYSATPGHPQVDRAALGSEASVAWQHWDSAGGAIAALRTRGCTVIALETSSHSEPVERFEFPFPCALVLGCERFGLNPELVASADVRLRIETFGVKNSLNVVSALAVAGFAARWHWNKRRQSP